jgi:type IV pilus assembly protein PilE
MKHARNGAGFSLIELLVIVTIIAILSAISIPMYTSYIQRANRSDARTLMLEAAAFMQRGFSQANQYPASLPSTYQRSPASGAKKYDIGVQRTDTTFFIAAVPAGSMAGDECQSLVLDQRGVAGRTSAAAVVADSGVASGMTTTNVDSAATVQEQCWKR